jgi:hypothetical protein
MSVRRTSAPRRPVKSPKKGARKVQPDGVASTIDAYGNTWTNVDSAEVQDLRDAERRLGTKFPVPLAELLLKCGGGRPMKNFFNDPRSDVFELGIGFVVSLRDRPRQKGLASLCQTYRTRQSLDPDLIPFAFDTGNANLICLRLPDHDIVYWVHDEPGQPVRRVARSLDDFLRGLGDCPF